MSSTPNLTGKSGIQLNKKLTYILDCPKCDEGIDVTDIKTDAHIECNKCKNVTWRPDYDPPWWTKTRNFVISLISALIIGIISTWVVNKITATEKPNTEQTDLNEQKNIEHGN